MSAPPPYWMLIAVLHSTLPLPEALAMRLYKAALDLYRQDEGRTKLTGDLASGDVRNLKKDLLLGAIAGPGFEADLDTPSGSGRVRFLLTRQALDQSESEERRPGGALPN